MSARGDATQAIFDAASLLAPNAYTRDADELLEFAFNTFVRAQIEADLVKPMKWGQNGFNPFSKRSYARG